MLGETSVCDIYGGSEVIAMQFEFYKFIKEINPASFSVSYFFLLQFRLIEFIRSRYKWLLL